MTKAGVSLRKAWLVLLFLSNGFLLSAQVTREDTADYVPEYWDNGLEYNLMIAASKGLDTETDRLINRGAEIDFSNDEGATSLIMAVDAIKLKTVNVLLSYGADPNKKTTSDDTPLLIILRKLTDLEQKNLNIITASKESECLLIAESLLRYGADIDLQDRFGVTPLNYASAYGSFRFVDLLLYYRADIDKKAFDGTTPLMAAVWAEHANVADLLVQNGANMEARDNKGFTSFLIAAQNGDTLLLDYFAKKGVDIYEQDQYGWDALSLSIKHGYTDAVEKLIRLGDKWKEQGRGALNYYNVAIKFGRKEIYGILERNNFPGRHKPQISQVETSLLAKFNLQDIYTGLSFHFREPKLNIGLLAGFDTKLWYTRALVEKQEGTCYQYMDKSSLAYAGVFKDIPLTNNVMKSNFIFTASLSAGYWFGNKFKGSLTAPENKFKIIPAASIRVVRKGYSIFAGLEFTSTDFYKTWPVWCRAGLSYNFDIQQSKTPAKIIRWY